MRQPNVTTYPGQQGTGAQLCLAQAFRDCCVVFRLQAKLQEMQSQRRTKCERWWRAFFLPRVLEVESVTQEMASIKTRALETLECGDLDGLISIMQQFEQITPVHSHLHL